MRISFLSIAAALALSTGAVSAQTATTIDTNVMCASGCTVMIDLTPEARHGETVILVPGQFTNDAEADPLQFAYSIVVNGTGADTFVLTSEPGDPRFATIEDVQAYMAGQDALMDRARRLVNQGS